MLRVTTPLLLLGRELLGEAIAGLQAGSLDADDAQMLSRRATALNRVVDLAVRNGLDDILTCENFTDLALLRDEHRRRFPELAREINRALGVAERGLC